jgi:hypothetical protein
MNTVHSQSKLRWCLLALVMVFSFAPAAAGKAAIAEPPCDQIKSQRDTWVKGRVDALILAARAAFDRDSAQAAYERQLDVTITTMRRCGLTLERDFVKSYSEFVDFVTTLSFARRDDHELGFVVPDRVYFSETRPYTVIPDFLLAPAFLRAVSSHETLPQAKTMLRELNLARAAEDKLLFFSYKSRHLGTPDNPDSFWRLLILVPGNAARNVPEKWVQFGVPDPKARAPVRNVSVVAVTPAAEGATNVYFKDYFRTFRRNGSITIKGRWELGEGDDNCAMCHKSGVLPIFPVDGSVSKDELGLVERVNARFRTYSKPRFDKYLDAGKLGPGLGSRGAYELAGSPAGSPLRAGVGGGKCGACHQPDGLGALNWPFDRVLISSYVNGGRMPFGNNLQPLERKRLYKELIQEYFSVDEANPGILKTWLLGRTR